MATNFDNNALASSGGFKPSTKDTPIDIRTRVETENDILSIPNPYVGMIVYVQDTGKRFEVLSIKDVQSGLSKVSRVDTYKEFMAGHTHTVSEITDLVVPTNLSQLQNDTSYVTEDYVANAISNAQLGGDGEVNLSGLINQKDGSIIKIWAGTKAEYDSLLVKNEDTIYLVEGIEGGSTTVTTYTITNNLVNCINNNESIYVNKNASYIATLTANEGYVISSVSVIMGDDDITLTCYHDGTITIDNVTGDIMITANAVASTGEDLPTPVYALPNALTLDGTGSNAIDTGYGLFDVDRDFTLLVDFTSAGNIAMDSSKQVVVFRVKQTKSPWIGVDCYLSYETADADPTQTRGDLVANPKSGIYLGKMATGVAAQTTERQKFVIKRVSSEKKMYFYDKAGLIGSYADAGTVANNLLDATVIIGNASGASVAFTGTIHDFKIWYESINDNDIATLLS